MPDGHSVWPNPRWKTLNAVLPISKNFRSLAVDWPDLHDPLLGFSERFLRADVFSEDKLRFFSYGSWTSACAHFCYGDHLVSPPPIRKRIDYGVVNCYKLCILAVLALMDGNAQWSGLIWQQTHNFHHSTNCSHCGTWYLDWWAPTFALELALVIANVSYAICIESSEVKLSWTARVSTTPIFRVLMWFESWRWNENCSFSCLQKISALHSAETEAENILHEFDTPLQKRDRLRMHRLLIETDSALNFSCKR